MAISGSISISFRDLGELPQDQQELERYCMDVLGRNCFLQLVDVASIQIGNVATRDVDPDLVSRGVSVGVSISF